ncbi:hypothetical protein [Altericroceibacterium xinjiangense]|uniref:hypothetical protein n=1 Tax=Altericroceibacterium xinjiangense TaxID=762261 RepID=UPI0013E0A069|nr:hypothetical protein [Altericroceibacterium xinjiangense]
MQESSRVGDPDEPERSFADARAKVSWAKFNLIYLEKKFADLTKEFQKSGGASYNSKAGQFAIGNAPVDPFYSCLAGDIVFSLRSALDCCWMGLRRAIDSEAGKGTLPRGNPESVEAVIQKASLRTKFPAAAEFILSELKPFKNGNETLWFIAQVDNWNKHNMLMLVIQHSHFEDARFNGQGIEIKLTNSGIVNFPDDNGIIGSPAFGPIYLDQTSSVSCELILCLQKPADKRPLIPFLKAALQETERGVGRFADFFGSGASPRQAE